MCTESSQKVRFPKVDASALRCAVLPHRDTAGQERYQSLAPLYYRGAAAAVVVYDITSLESFQKAKHWVAELQKNTNANIGAAAHACIVNTNEMTLATL